MRTTHGMHLSREYRTWADMKTRCLNEKSESYPSYGGRGIKICPEWVDSFENFFSDMGKRPDETYSLDRINNDGDYEPSNCRWATKTQQVLNRGLLKSNTSGVRGVSWNKKRRKWKAYIRTNGKTIDVGFFENIPEAAEARRLAELTRDCIKEVATYE